MGILLLNIAFVSIGAVLGACAGWWLRGSELPGPSLVSPPERFDPKPSKQVASSVAVDSPAAADYGEVEAMMARLHQVAESVAADVGRHNNRVQEISSELSSNQGEIDVVGTVAKLIQMNEAMQNQLHSAEERLQAQAKEIESHVREARTDALTKLANRRAFDDEMARCVEEYRRSGRPSCVMMIDVDHFKKFNDTCGHQAGDEVLRGVGRVLRRSVCGKEIVCRYGGEEFAIIFPGSDLASARPAAERARAAIGQAMFEFEGRELK